MREYPGRHVVVVMDRAKPHASKLTKSFIAIQTRLHVFYLPRYSADWNPDEVVWNHLSNHELNARRAGSKEELSELAAKKPDAKHGPATLRLEAVAGVDRQATGELLPLVYGELRTLAAARFAFRGAGLDWFDAA